MTLVTEFSAAPAQRVSVLRLLAVCATLAFTLTLAPAPSLAAAKAGGAKAAAAAAGPDDGGPPDIARIHRRHKLVVAILSKDNPPFFSRDAQGNWHGADIRLARRLGEILGVDVAFKTADKFDDVVSLVANRQADIAISKISRTMKRAQSVRFSNPYVRMRQGLLINRLQLAQVSNGRKLPTVIKSLEGKIGVVGGGSYVGFAKLNFPKATLVEFPTWDAAVAAVKKGDVLAIYRDEMEVKKILRDSPNSSLLLQTVVLSDTQDPIAMALHWDSATLLAVVNQLLDNDQILYTPDALLDEFSAKPSAAAQQASASASAAGATKAPIPTAAATK